MRLTLCLCKTSKRFLQKQLWKLNAVHRRPRLLVPSLMDKDVKFEDPLEWKTTKSFPAWEPPVKDDPRFMPPKTEKDHPDYHEDPIYSFHSDTCLLEGETQASILTKSQCFHDLPERLKELCGTVHIDGQDELVQRYLMQAHIWDPTKEKLKPRPKNPDLSPIWKFKAEYGIPPQKIISILLRNILRLCSTLGGRFPDLLNSRSLVVDPYISTNYFSTDNTPLLIQGSHDFLLSTNHRLAPLASTDDIDASVAHKLPDLFPISPLIDLKKQHVYNSDNITGWREGSTRPFPHTLFLANTQMDWNVSQRNAQSLMFIFGHCLATAKKQYGEDVKILPESVTAQCIVTDGTKFDFVCYQLNTLNFDSEDGIKNFAWFHNDQAMIQKILPKRSMLRNTLYHDYDPSVLDKILAFYINGVKLDTEDS